jgi:hypothetical protein
MRLPEKSQDASTEKHTPTHPHTPLGSLWGITPVRPGAVPTGLELGRAHSPPGVAATAPSARSPGLNSDDPEHVHVTCVSSDEAWPSIGFCIWRRGQTRARNLSGCSLQSCAFVASRFFLVKVASLAIDTAT